MQSCDSTLPISMNSVGPLNPNDANKAKQRAEKSFLVASGCCQVNKLEKKNRYHTDITCKSSLSDPSNPTFFKMFF